MHRLPCLVCAALVAAPAAAQPVTTVEDRVEEAHRGLFLRITPGIAGSAAQTTYEDTDYKLQGGAGRLGIAVGWAVSPRWIVAAELLGHVSLGPELESDGMTTVTDDDVAWGVSYAGIGFNHYLRSNVYFTASAGGLMMTLDTDEMDVGETDLGFGLKLGVGKEWWVANEVGLGVGLELLAGSVPDGDADWAVATFGLAFSATYN